MAQTPIVPTLGLRGNFGWGREAENERGFALMEVI